VVTKLSSQTGNRIVWLGKLTSTLGQELLHDGSHVFDYEDVLRETKPHSSKSTLAAAQSGLAPLLLLFIFRRSKTLFSAGRQLRQQRLRALAISRRRNLRRLSITLRHTLVLLAHLLRHTARVADGRRIAVVGVDANEVRGHTINLDVADHDVTRTSVPSAVATAAVNLSDAYKGRIFDRHSAASVVLDDFVFGCVGSAALPEDVAGAESRNGICRETVSKAFPRRFV
jgi:hypothetical protein